MPMEPPASDDDRQLLIAERRLARRERWINRVKGELNRLTYERSEIEDEFRLASEIYARKIERLAKKSAKNVADVRKLAQKVESEAGQYQD